MLLNFVFKNFRSFRDEKTLSMEAAGESDLSSAVICQSGYKILPVAVLYGANSSGKSNVLKAFMTMRNVLLSNVRLNPHDVLDFHPFCLDKVSPTLPTSFEIQFIIDNVRYRYGFDYDKQHICSEWLYEKIGSRRENNLFLRLDNDFNLSKTLFKEGIGKEDVVLSNRLFVSLVAQLNGPKSIKILSWFENCNFISGMNNCGFEDFTLQIFKDHNEDCKPLLDFFRHSDLGFNDLLVSEKNASEANDVSETGNLVEAKTTHYIYDTLGAKVGTAAFDAEEMESEGTKKVIRLSGPVFDALRTGKILVIDELEARLHPMLTAGFVQLFMNPNSNQHAAQLIFATHDTNLLNMENLRKDQIWFTEKDKTESSDLYSLVEFKTTNNEIKNNKQHIRQNYINGRYGGIPLAEM